jgi:hypothetical protein
VTRRGRARGGRMDVLCCRERTSGSVRLRSRQMCRLVTPGQIEPAPRIPPLRDRAAAVAHWALGYRRAPGLVRATQREVAP